MDFDLGHELSWSFVTVPKRIIGLQLDPTEAS